MIGAADSAHLVGHLAYAVAEHLRWCRLNGIAAPPEMDALLSILQASGGPGGTPVAFEPSIPDARLVGYQEAAAMLGVSVRTVRRMVADGRLSSARIGSRVLVPAAAVDEYIDAKEAP